MKTPSIDIIVEHLSRMQEKLYTRHGRRVVTRLSVDSEVGLCMGIVPGTCALVYTTCGYVEVYCERRLDIEFEKHRGA